MSTQKADSPGQPVERGVETREQYEARLMELWRDRPWYEEGMSFGRAALYANWDGYGGGESG